ncbi:globin-like protein [Phaeosphaeriaceae sp. SRC1lsM3a]|nr:globin-like protein [Stagonospora sp. SRC1lsM3a]
MSSLTPSQVKIIKATVPVLAEHGNTITTKMYADMLEANPDLRNVFNNVHQKSGHQPQALAGALYAYAANIDDLGVLSPALELICHKHASLYIRREHYGVVGTNLLQTMKTVLGEAATPDIMEAWEAAYWQLANIMIGKEDSLYKSTNGWDDWKDFKISRKVKESDEITSFYLTPVEADLRLPSYKPGQYICVNILIDELDGGVWQARQYSLSDAPGKDYLRISVKKEPGVEVGEPKHIAHEGYVSNVLHEKKMEGDVIRVSHPFGDFFLEEKEDNRTAPVVLISAGVGLTCLMSILNSLIANKSTRPISWVQGARNSSTRAFKKEIDTLVAENKNVCATNFSSNPNEGEIEGRDFDIKGRINLDRVDKRVLFTENQNTEYFVCGPSRFMMDVEARLNRYGVPSERIKMELFGTGGVPRT